MICQGQVIDAGIRAGAELWHEGFLWASELTINNRSEPAYADMPRRFRVNKPTRANIERVNSRVCSRLERIPAGLQLATSDNWPRKKLNTKAFEQFADQAHRSMVGNPPLGELPFVRILLGIVAEGRIPENFLELKRRIRKYTEKRLNKMCGTLDVAIGGGAIVNANDNTSHGISNGTKAIFAKVVYKKGAKIQFYQRTERGTPIPCVFGGQAKHIVLKHTLPGYVDRNICSTLPPGYFVLKPRSFNKVKFGFGSLTVSVKLTGFQCAPSSAITIHKTQGMTLPNLLLCQFGSHSKGGDGWLYVALSRVRRLEDLYLLKPIPESVRSYRRRRGIQNEEDRLQRLARETRRKLTRFWS